MSTQTCPVCGSSDLVKTQIAKVVADPFGGDRKIDIDEYLCNNCGADGDFFNQNDEKVNTAICELRQDAVLNILQNFVDQKISFSGIERALDLPQRTLTKWKNNVVNPTSTGVVLLKYLKLFPWLLDVAEMKFDYSTAQKIHIQNAMSQMLRYMEFNERGFSGTVNLTPTTNYNYIHIENYSNTKTPNVEPNKTFEVKFS
ncbi:MAG: hypothetical protein Q8L88_13145 [Bacteroidota bacterium]|nr:hypothetical protein [Bacteroidota bacterium]